MGTVHDTCISKRGFLQFVDVQGAHWGNTGDNQ